MSRRWCSHKHYDGRISSKLLDSASVKHRSSSSSSHEGTSHGSSLDVYSQMAGNWGSEGDKGKDSSVVFSSVHQSQEKRQVTPSDRPVRVEPHAEDSHFQNGNCFSDLQSSFRNSMGMLDRHRGCILPCADKLGLSQVSCLQAEGSDLRVPVPAFRPFSSTMGILQSNKTHQEETSLTPDLHILIPRRLYNLREIPDSSSRSIKDGSRSPSITGIQDKLDKIQLNSFTNGGISRRHVGPQVVDPVSSAGQTTRYHQQMSDISSKGHSISKGTGELDRRVELCRILHRLGKASSDSHHVVGQSQHAHSDQRRTGSTRLRFQGTSQDLDKSVIPQPSSSDASCQTDPLSDDGCLSGGLVRHPSSPEDHGQMEPHCTIIVNELEGTEGCPSSLVGVPCSAGRESSPTTLGQFHDCSMHQTSGFSETQTPSLTDIGDPTILQKMAHQSPSCSPTGGLECTGGSGIPSSPDCYGVVSRPDHLCIVGVPGSTSSNRPVCDQGKYSASPIHLSLPGPSGSGIRRIQHVVEPLDVHLPDASLELPRPSSFLPDGVSRDGGSCSSFLAFEGLVSPSSPQVSEGLPPSSKESHTVSDDITGSGNPQQCTVLEPSRLDTVNGPMVELGLDEAGVRLVSRAHRDSTINQYQGTWKRFLDFLDEKSIAHQDVTKVVVMNFLAHEHSSRNLAYRTIAAYKCALAIPLELKFNIKLDDTPVNLLMRGVFNDAPPHPAPMPLWSLNHLLAYLSSDMFEPDDDGVSHFLITRKVLCLTLLATGRRIDEVAHLSQHVTWENGGSLMKLHWLPNYVPKHYNKDFKPPMPAMECLAGNSVFDARLCPVKALQSYLAIIRPVTGSAKNQPLWSYNTVDLSKMFVSTVRRARRMAGDTADIPMGPHQMRKFAASYSALIMRSINLPQKILLDRMGCKTMSVLNRTYINKVPRLNFKAVVPVGTFSPVVHNEE